MINLLEVNGDISQPRFWRYWLICNLANAATVAILFTAAAFGWGWLH